MTVPHWTFLSEHVQSAGVLSNRFNNHLLSRVNKPCRDRQPNSTSHSVGVGVAIGSEASGISQRQQGCVARAVTNLTLHDIENLMEIGTCQKLRRRAPTFWFHMYCHCDALPLVSSVKPSAIDVTFTPVAKAEVQSIAPKHAVYNVVYWYM